MKKIIFWILALAAVTASFGGGALFGYSQRPHADRALAVCNKETELSFIEQERQGNFYGIPSLFDKILGYGGINKSTTTVNFEPFWKAWNLIESRFVSKNGFDRQKMVWGAISGLAGSLDDPYTVFFPPQETKAFKEEMGGNFQGVGMEIGIREKVLTVVAPLPNTPAEKAGIKAGDKILEINGENSVSMSVEKAVQKIRGEKGTTVILTIMHKTGDKPVKISVTRDVIQVPVIKTEQKKDSVFVIKLFGFTGNAPVVFEGALKEFVNSGSDKLILDLRGNPGGYLESAVDIAGWFLPAGEVVAREKFSNGEETLFRSAGKGKTDRLPFVILVDEGSASASEILAGALREHGIAKLVGQKTFGKGSVQELLDIAGGSALKLTIARWLTPNGVSISETGIEPDVVVEIKEGDIKADRDPQMEKAIELLNKW